MLNLENLQQITNNDNDAINRLLQTFFDTTAQDLDNLKIAIAEEQKTAIARIAHRIKGAALTVGATELYDAAVALETKVHGDATARQQQYGRMQQSFDSLLAHCRP